MLWREIELIVQGTDDKSEILGLIDLIIKENEFKITAIRHDAQKRIIHLENRIHEYEKERHSD